MSKSSKMKDYGGHKGGGKDYGGHKGGGKDYGGSDKVCKTDPQPNPQPQPQPNPPTDNTDCRPVADNDHHGAVISAGVDADVSAKLLQCDSLVNLDADIGAYLDLDLGHDSWHA
jgi:hypothetical protein